MKRRPEPIRSVRAHRPARGQFNLPTLLALLVLLLVAVIALRYALNQAAQKRAQSTARTVAIAPVPKAPPASSAVPHAISPGEPARDAPASAPRSPRPDAHGLSFGLMPRAPGRPTDTVHVGCHGEPKVFGRPHQGSCNPHQGATACNIVLPVLCVRPTGAAHPGGLPADFGSGWVHGSLGASEPVMGALLDSPEAASRQCERALGPGWRIAELHDGQGGLEGLRGPGLRDDTRYWVHINDQPANCWN